MRAISITVFLALLAGAALSAVPEARADASRAHIEFHRKVRGAIVAVRGPRMGGTGIVISSDGLILTSSHVTGERGTVKVWLEGHRFLKGEIVFAKKEMEVALVRVETKDKLPVLKLGDSDKLRIGEPIYVVGNVQGAIEYDDMPAMSLGVLSGRFDLDQSFGGHPYKGPVIETTAAVNPGLGGGPFLNRKGEVVGLITLNYSTKTWTGVAIPINLVRRVIEESGVFKEK